MDIAIIGAGNVGRSLATAFVARRARRRHRVARSRGRRQRRRRDGCARRRRRTPTPRPPPRSSCSPSRPRASPDIAAEIADAVAGKIVVDVTNRMTLRPDGPGRSTRSSSNAEDARRRSCRARSVVKAFNTVFASQPGRPDRRGRPARRVRRRRRRGREGGPSSTSSPRSASSPVDVGPLVRARQLEGLAFLNIALNVANGGTWQSGWKLVGAPATPVAAAGRRREMGMTR